VAIRLAPINEETGLRRLHRQRSRGFSADFVVSRAGDVQAVARTMSALSRFIAEFSDRISEIRSIRLRSWPNGQGCLALDCVLIRTILKRKHLVES